ncbi:MAG: translocation and assembly module TamB [Acidobacteriota bacterium]|jgi:hypothetical protein|nr:translocation and assembly module TamB [Acidobacteriota bacterium]
MYIRSAARTTQRPEGSEEDDGSSPADGWFRIFVAAASLALLFLVPIASLGAAEAPAAPKAPAPAPDVPKVTLSAAELPATGSQKTLLTVDRFGRYSVRVENAQGSSIELVDRMAGSLGRAGEAGTESGRLDLFLDRGQYQVRVESAKKGTGKVKVQARSFQDRDTAAPRLVETRLVQATLDDLEQVSFWLEIGERRGVRLEAAGRSLADLRLWRDGSWLEGVEPQCQQIQPVVGQPLWRCRLAAVLEPGLYLLTAYGGIAQPWSEGSDEHPLYVRWGEPRLPESGRRRYVVSPFGEDHFLLPDNVNFFRVELPEARPAALAVGWVRAGSHYDQVMGMSSGAVTKESVPPAVEVVRTEGKPGDDVQAPEVTSEDESSEEVSTEDSGEPEEQMSEGEEGSGGDETTMEESSGEGETEEAMEGEPAAESPEPAPEEPAAPPSGPLPWELVATVVGVPGQAYVLQHFEQRDVYSFSLSGPHWVSSVHAGAAEDSVDATAVVTDTPPGEKERFLTAAAIPLDQHTAWSRRFNFQDALTLFLEVKEAGAYRVVGSGAGARARIEPFLLVRPEHYESPAWQGASSSWNLDPGYYVLSLEPQSKGILTLTLRPGKASPEVPTQPAQAAVRFAPLTLDPTHRYTAYVNHQPGVVSGLVVRPWPVDLSQPLPVSQKPGEAFEIPFHIDVEGTLRAEPDDGTRLDVAVDGGAWSPQAQVAPGDHTVAVRHDRLGTVTYSLWVEPAILQDWTPLPPLPDAALNALPKLPVLKTGAPRFLDLDRGQTSSYLVQAGKPGLYAVRSTGLLATAGTLRTRTVPELRRDAQNGVGRNFLVQQYLREGDYQVTVAALGKSRGHAGLALEATQLLDGGELRAGMPGHFTLPAGQAVVFRVAVTEAGQYTLRALGLGFKFLCRFEDADGWPLEKPNIPADLDERLEAGTYRFVLLPQPVDARALVLLEKQPEPLEFAGHGPHALPLETAVGHVWVEPEGPEGLIEDAPRPPDVWRFELPATVHAAVELTDEMQGRLSRLDASGNATDLGFVPPGRAWKGELEPGRYQVAAECSRRNSRVHYQITVHTEELVTGLERKVTAPGEVAVAVGRDSLTELTSIAPADVRARLLDADGRVVAENDDRPDDWNFLLFQRLAPGRYTLRVEPVGVSTTEVRIEMRTPAELEKVSERASAALPVHDNLQLGSDVLLRSLPVGPKADLLLVAARSKDSLGLSVERKDGEAWRTVGTSIARDAHLEIPLSEKGEAYRLRLWSLDRHETPVRLSAAALSSQTVSERELRRGANLKAVAGFDPPLSAALVELDRPGVFRFADPGPDLRGSGVAGSPLDALEGAVLSSPGQRFWLVRQGKGSGALKAERVTVAAGLDAGAQFPVPDGAAVTADLGDSSADGPVLALATAPSGQPGVRVGESGEDPRQGMEPAATVMGVGPRTAVAVGLAPRHPIARVWQAGAGDGGTEELRLAQLRFPAAKAETAGWGVLDGHLDGIVARRLDLPAGPRKLRLALGEATVAVLSRGDVVVSTHWQGGAPFEELLDDSAADRLTLLHTRLGSDPFTIELLPRDSTEEALSLSSGAPFERSLDRAGTLRIALGVATPSTLHVRGAGSEVVLLGRDGTVVRGTDVPAGRGGVALVRHGPGLLLAWLGGPDDETAALWPVAEGQRPAAVKVAPPASVPLSGRFAELALAGSGPRVLHLRTAEPLATLLHRADGSNDRGDEVEVHAEGGRLDAFLPPGEARLGLRSLAGAQLSGVAEITETPVTPIGEGLGPEVLLPAGGSRWFSFHVERKGPVGVGAHAGSDVVEIELYDRAGRRLEGKPAPITGGVVRMPELMPGDYLLALSSPAAAQPVKARPAVAGLVLPDTGPPADVIRQYLEEAGAEEAPAPESVPGSQP